MAMTVPFLDLNAQFRAIEADVRLAIDRTLSSSHFSLGEEVFALEEEFAAYCGSGFGVGVNSGSSALHLALLACGIGPGDEVITVSMTFVATVAAIDYVGATPVVVDVDPGTLNMDPAKIEAQITERTKAIMPVHLHGGPADMEPILRIARRHGLRVIEDAAQAHGARYGGRRVGSCGDLGCFSFYPGKNLGAYGEAGMVVTDDESLAREIAMLRDWGQSEKYRHVRRGFNFRMDGIQGGVLRVKLRHLDAWNQARRNHAAHYGQLLAGLDCCLPRVVAGGEHVYHVYGIRAAGRERVRACLTQRGVQTGIHYPIPVHRQPAYEGLCKGAPMLPVTDAASNELLSLPMFPELTHAQVETVCDVLREAHLESA
jgi:dTDP-4-amino-4,6-dideoxygalactose transaminase